MRICVADRALGVGEPACLVVRSHATLVKCHVRKDYATLTINITMCISATSICYESEPVRRFA